MILMVILCKGNEVNPGSILLCCVVMEISTGWGVFGGGGGDLTASKHRSELFS